MNSNPQNTLKKTKIPVPVIVIAAGLLVVAILLIWQGISRSAQPMGAGDEIPFPDIQRISIEDAKKAYDAKSALFLDVSNPTTYSTGHVMNALNIPLNELQERYKELDKNTQIITYCTCPAEQTSARAASMLKDQGFKNVQPLLGGFAAWQKASYPVQTR